MTKFKTLDLEHGTLRYPAEPEVQLQTDLNDDVLTLNFAASLREPMDVGAWWIELDLQSEGTFYWSPHLSPEEGDIADLHIFRTPALIAGTKDSCIALIPDHEQRFPAGVQPVMDVDAAHSKLRVGLATTEPHDHTLFRETGDLVLPAGEFRYRLQVLTCDPSNPFDAVLKFFDPILSKALDDTSGLPRLENLGTYQQHAYRWAYESWPIVYQSFEYDGEEVGAPQFIVTAHQSPNNQKPHSIRESCSIWFQAWFHALRTALGVAHYAKRTGRSDLYEQALKTKRLALRMPQEDGLFPAVVAVPEIEKLIAGKPYRLAGSWDDAYFGNSNRNPLTWNLRESPLHLLDMSRTGIYLLDWYEQLEQDPAILAYLHPFAEKLLKLQDAEGYFPAWIHEGDVLPALAQSPESASIASFLLRWSTYEDDPSHGNGSSGFKDSAIKSIEVLLTDVLPIGRWEDFETYWSCSRFGVDHLGKRFERNHMFKQNSLSIFFLAEALLLAYEHTSEERFLKYGKRALDELLMYQSSYQPAHMPVAVVGGFGVMNGDGELNDSRQSLFAPLILRYGNLTGIERYKMRGLAALRASFTMMYCPENPELKQLWEDRWPFFNEVDYGFMMENFAHGGSLAAIDEMLGEFSIFDWGAGAAAEAYERVFREGWLD